jgi:radical SAM superfamily enzyme YgiQ (UPF0313 family)
MPKKIYRTTDFADITLSPVPDYHLVSMADYASMVIQVTRGCPFSCDFCEITSLLGKKVRMKNSRQVIEELEMMHHLNWRGPVSIVDDNFIGNKKEVKNDLLPVMKTWMKQHRYPFTFTIQSSINLADDDELMQLMLDAGFGSAFIGIETPDEICLQDCNKVQNKDRDLLQSVKKIQKTGIEVSGGFIVGFDSDSPDVFQRQIDFIQQSGIVTAMVGLLNAPKNTQLYQRLKAENRLTTEPTGSNTDQSMNFIPKMNSQELLEGYRKILDNIYSTRPYYKRVRQFFLNYRRKRARKTRIKLTTLNGFIKSVLIIGIFSKGRREYWKFITWTLFRRPGMFMEAIIFTVYGYHFRAVFGLGKSNIFISRK